MRIDVLAGVVVPEAAVRERKGSVVEVVLEAEAEVAEAPSPLPRARTVALYRVVVSRVAVLRVAAVPCPGGEAFGVSEAIWEGEKEYPLTA